MYLQALFSACFASLAISSGGSGTAAENDYDWIDTLFAAFSADSGADDQVSANPNYEAVAVSKPKKVRYSVQQEEIVREVLAQYGHLSNYFDMYLKLVPIMNAKGLAPMGYESFRRRAKAYKEHASLVQTNREKNLSGMDLSTFLENLYESDPSISEAYVVDAIKSKGYTFSPSDVRKWFAFKKFILTRPGWNQVSSSAVIHHKEKVTVEDSSLGSTGKRKRSPLL